MTDEVPQDFLVKGMQEWRLVQTSGSSPSARCWAGSCVVGNELYVFGGYSGKRVNSAFLSDLHALNLDTHEWREVSPYGVCPPGRYAHTLTSVGNKIYCFGGAAGKFYDNSLYVYEVVSQTWSRIVPNGVSPLPRCAHTAVRVGKCIYIFGGDHGLGKYLDDLLGGCNESRKPPLFNDMWTYDCKTSSWELCNVNKLPPPRYSHATVSIGSVIGGKNKNEVIGDVHWFSTGGIEVVHKFMILLELMGWWEPNFLATSSKPKNRYAPCAALYKNRIYLFGGYSGYITFNDLYILDFDPQRKIESQLMIDISTLVNNRNFSDVTFLVEGRKIYAHRNILASRCAYFSNMFLSNLKEANQTEIKIEDQRYTVFFAFLRYVYAEIIDEKNVDETLDLLTIANIYQYDKMKQDLSDVLKRYMVVENACRLYQHAHHNSCHDLEKECLTFIINNYKILKKSKGFTDIDEESMKTISTHKKNRKMEKEKSEQQIVLE